MSHKSPTEKLLATRFRQLAELREDKLPDEAPSKLETEVLDTINQVADTTDIDNLLNVGTTASTSTFLEEVVEPEEPQSDEK